MKSPGTNQLIAEVDHPCGWTASGVARARHRDPADLQAFQTAFRLEPENAYTRRNAAALLVGSDPAAVLPLFEKALALLPDDQLRMLGYGSCLKQLARRKEPERTFRKCLAVNSLTEIAEQARAALTKLAHATMRSRVGGIHHLAPEGMFNTNPKTSC